MPRIAPIALAALLCLAVPGAVLAQSPGPGPYRVAFVQPGAGGYTHGQSFLARLGRRVLVGSPAETSAVDVYDAATGARRSQLTPIAFADSAGFGRGVAASSAGFLVGDSHANEVYLFDRRTNGLRRTFRPPADVSAQDFGAAIADLGSTIVVGDPTAPLPAPNGIESQGAVHLFVRRSGTWLRRLVDPVYKRQSLFGASVVRVPGGFAVGQPAGYYDPGSVFVYDRHGELVQTLAAPEPVALDRFGTALAVSGTRLLVGSPGVIGGIVVPGRAYLYERRGGRFELQSIFEGPADLGFWFGRAVAIDHDRVVVGATAGAAVFSVGEPEPRAVLLGPAYDFDLYDDTQYLPWSGLGASVAIVGPTIVVASEGADENAGSLVVGFAPNATPPAVCGSVYLCP